MTKKNKPTRRQVEIFKEDVDSWHGISLDSLASKLGEAARKATQHDRSMSDFVIDIDRDDYNCVLTVWGYRDETAEERAHRLEQSKRAKVARQLIATKRKENELAELKRLCKKLKITSPV